MYQGAWANDWAIATISNSHKSPATHLASNWNKAHKLQLERFLLTPGNASSHGSIVKLAAIDQIVSDPCLIGVHICCKLAHLLFAKYQIGLQHGKEILLQPVKALQNFIVSVDQEL